MGVILLGGFCLLGILTVGVFVLPVFVLLAAATSGSQSGDGSEAASNRG